MAASTGPEECSRALPFVAVGRVGDGVCLASCSAHDTEEQREKAEDIFKKLLTAAKQKLKPGQRTRLQWNEGSVCCMMDQQGSLLLCVVTSFMEYPERHAYELLREVQVAAQEHDCESAAELGLGGTLKSRLEQLMAKYEDPSGFDQVGQALDKVNVVRSVMSDNLRQVQDTGRSLQDLQAKSDLMSQHSQAFNQASHDALQRMLWRKWAMRIGVAVILIILIVLIIVLARK